MGLTPACAASKASPDAVSSTHSARPKAVTPRSPAPTQADRVIFETAAGPRAVRVEVVASRAARAKGLMGRETLAAGFGMLFVFERLEVQTFWMRNTLISLDMIFIAGEPSGGHARVVGVVHEAAPHSTQIRSVERASRFVVEVPGGWAASHGITAGVEVRFDGPAQ